MRKVKHLFKDTEVCPELVYLWEDSRFLCEWIAVNDVLNACTEREGGC